MKTLPPASKPAKVRDSLHQHLHMYALAASAAGVSVLALAQPGEAEIIYTPTNVTIGPNHEYGLDLNNDGVVDFTIKDRSLFSSIFASGGLWVKSPAGNDVAAHLAFGLYSGGGFRFAYVLSSGIPISQQARHFSAGRATMTWFCFCDAGGFYRGSWLSHSSNQPLSSRYLGFKFKINGEVHYGWARLNALGPLDGAVLTGYAYETIANQGLNAGQEEETEKTETKVEQPDPAAFTQPAQKPATLGVLAHGSSGLPMWRKR
ncbi:MAG: hypothetical protein WCC19_20390 [Terriglobales bacterium]